MLTSKSAPDAILAPLTKGGNLPFRRLCAFFGADVTVSEMAYAREILRKNKRERALLRHHPEESSFGVQLASNKPEEFTAAGVVAAEVGAEFIELNCGCPTYEVSRRGLGACLLSRPSLIGRMVASLTKRLAEIGSPCTVRVKIRAGENDDRINACEVSRIAEESGATLVTLHARTREQRYSRAADWTLVAQLVEERSVPVVGNGDLLTLYDVMRRRRESNCHSVMIGRGALIKPWIFREIKRGEEWFPSPEERIGIYWALGQYMKEHFRDDEKGQRRAMEFLPWHFGFFCRYRPYPEEVYYHQSCRYPLIQSRFDDEECLSPLETILRSILPAVHESLALIMWDAKSADDAVDRVEGLMRRLWLPRLPERALPPLESGEYRPPF